MRKEVAVVLLVVGVGIALYAGGAVLFTQFIADGTAEKSSVTAADGTLSFADVTEESGIDYESRRDDTLRGTQSMMSNSGVYATDFDSDGETDVLLIGGERPLLYENDGGTFSETDAVPDVDGHVRAALFFDHDGDGSEDLLLLRTYDSPVFLENRGGEFTRVGAGFGEALEIPIGAAAADYTGNGCLDVFVIQNGNWRKTGPTGQVQFNVAAGQDNGLPNRLYEGDCESFTDVTEEAGIQGDRWSLATSFVDLDGDELPDIHVANDYNRDVVYYNDGDGTFERTELGASTNRNGMSSTVADVTGNGRLDIFVTNIWFSEELGDRAGTWALDYTGNGNNLLRNEGNRTFESVGDEYGVRRGGWGWAAVLDDLTNDGSLDLFHATRHYEFPSSFDITDEEAEAFHDQYSFYRYPAVWEGKGDEFEQLSPSETGFDSMDSRGVAELDANGNGKLDLLVANNAGAFKLYENRAEGGSAVLVDVEPGGSTPAIGARVTVEADGETYHRVVESNSDYLSQGTRQVHVGLDDATSATITVAWPDGTTRTFDDVATNQQLVVAPSGPIETRSLATG